MSDTKTVSPVASSTEKILAEVSPVDTTALVKALVGKGWCKLPDDETPDGYAGVLIVPHPSTEGALAVAFLQPNAEPLLVLTVRAERRVKDIAMLLHIADTVSLPYPGDGREVEKGGDFSPSRVHCLGVYDGDLKKWIAFGGKREADQIDRFHPEATAEGGATHA